MEAAVIRRPLTEAAGASPRLIFFLRFFPRARIHLWCGPNFFVSNSDNNLNLIHSKTSSTGLRTWILLHLAHGCSPAQALAMYPIAIGLAIRNNALWSDVTAALRDLPFRVVFDHPEVEDRQGLVDRIEHGAPDVVLLECTNKTDVLQEIMAGIRATGPSPLVIALHASPELEGAVMALRAGVMESSIRRFVTICSRRSTAPSSRCTAGLRARFSASCRLRADVAQPRWRVTPQWQ